MALSPDSRNELVKKMIDAIESYKKFPPYPIKSELRADFNEEFSLRPPKINSFEPKIMQSLPPRDDTIVDAYGIKRDAKTLLPADSEGLVKFTTFKNFV